MAELLADTMITSGEDGFIIQTDGGSLELFNRGKCIDAYKFGVKPVKKNVDTIKVNLNVFKNPNGKVVKYKLEEYLYKAINHVLDKQKSEEFYKNMLIKNNPTRQVNRKNTQRVIDNTEDSDDLEL